MARLAICLFGPFRVTLEGRPAAAFESDKVRALLAYLASQPGIPHRREKLAGLLWPDWPEPAARANLSRALTNLRHAIGERDAATPALSVSWQAVALNASPDIWIDVAEFQRWTDEDSDSAGDAEGQITRLASAVSLCRGTFLEGFTLPGCPEFEEWALFEGERLQRVALNQLEHLSRWCETHGNLQAALDHAWRLVELAPWNETGHQRLMRLLLNAGQRDAAIAHFESFRRYLADELDVSPSDETLQLSEEIRHSSVAMGRAGFTRHNLGAPLTPFIGRQAELAELAVLLRNPGCRLVTVVGPAGIGKTRLALEAAKAQMDRFPDGVFQVALVGLASAGGIAPFIATAIGLSYRRDVDATRQLFDYLAGKTMLLVLDNFEHLLAGIPMLIDLLHAAPGVTALITSRIRLDLQGEHLLLLEGMAVPPAEMRAGPGIREGAGGGAAAANATAQLGAPADPTAYEAFELFVSGARRVLPGFRAAEHTGDVGKICRLLDGVPLAILLASAWVGTLTPAAIADRIEHGLDLLEVGWQDVPERHRSMKAALDCSWSTLTPLEQEIFCALSVFRGSFDVRAAQVVANASAGELRGLVDKSFLHRLPDGRYEVHEMLRQYGTARLGETTLTGEMPDAWDGAHNRHRDFYLASLERAGAEIKGPRQQVALAEIALDIANIYAAWSWASEHTDLSQMGEALEGLRLFCERKWRFEEGEEACRLGATALACEASVPGLRLRVRLLACRAAFNRLLERRTEAAQLLREATALLDRAESTGAKARWEKALLMFEEGLLAMHSDRTAARLLHEKSAESFDAACDPWWAAAALREAGRIAFYQGAHDDATRLIERSLNIRRSLGDRKGIADSLDGLGIVATYRGQLDEAERLLRESVAIAEASRDTDAFTSASANLGASLAVAGLLDEGRAALFEAVRVLGNLGRSWSLAHAQAMMSLVTMWCGRLEDALAESAAATTLSEEMGYWRGSALASLVRGGVALARQDYRTAFSRAGDSVALMRKIRQRDDLGYALALLSAAEAGLGKLAEAREHACEAVRLAAEIGSYIATIGLPACLSALARGSQTGLVPVLGERLVSELPLVLRSPWYRQVIENGAPDTVASRVSDPGRLSRDLVRHGEVWSIVADLAAATGCSPSSLPTAKFTCSSP